MADVDVNARYQTQLLSVRPPAFAHTAANLHEHGTGVPSAYLSGDGSNLVGAAAGALSSPIVTTEALIYIYDCKMTQNLLILVKKRKQNLLIIF